MKPQTEPNYAPPTGSHAGQTACSPFFNAGYLVPDSGDQNSSSRQSLRNNNNTNPSLQVSPNAIPPSWQYGMCRNETYGGSIPATSFPCGNTPDFLSCASLPSNIGAKNETSQFLASNELTGSSNFDAFSKDLFPDTTRQGHAESDIFISDNTLLDEGSAIFGSWTSPTTFIDPFTPSLNEQTPWPTMDFNGKTCDGQAIPFDSFPSPHVGYTPDLFDFGTNYISPQQSNPPAAPSAYPPLPEIDAPPEDSMHILSNPDVAFAGSYLPAWSVADDMSSWFHEDQPRGQNLWNEEGAIEASGFATPSGPAMTGRNLFPRGGLRDTSKDEYLVQCKERGMSYKQIKESGGFEEAESTLRGRYRALTKPREARLRKPEWGQREIDLLFEGVEHCSRSNSGNLIPSSDLDDATITQFVNKVPWKQVAEYMESQGAYRYGNATVKKKYLEVLKERGAPARMDRNYAR